MAALLSFQELHGPALKACMKATRYRTQTGHEVKLAHCLSSSFCVFEAGWFYVFHYFTQSFAILLNIVRSFELRWNKGADKAVRHCLVHPQR